MRGLSFFLALAAAALLLGLGSSAQAGITYQDLINAGSGGTNFTLANGVEINVYDAALTITPKGTVVSPAASAITVTTSSLIAGGTNYAGLQFAAGFGALGASSSLDDLFTFDVRVMSSGVKITDMHAFANLGATGAGSATLQETIRQLDSSPPTTVLNITLTPTNTSVNATLGGAYTSISISKDLILNAPNAGDSATLSQIQQLLSFSPASIVPEPSSMALFGIGMTGLLVFRRYFKKTPGRLI